MQSEFFQCLTERIQTLQKHQEPLLVSGGSASTFMLQLFSRLTTSPQPLEVVYLQFEHFHWLEREHLRRLAERLSVSYRELPLSSDLLTASSEWKIADEGKRYQLLWRFIDSQLDFKAVAGLGWRNYLRTEEDLSLPGHTLTPPALALSKITPFYTSELWETFLKHPGCETFFEYWKEIPFDDIRYWQDYVFKKILPDFVPTLEWKLQKTL